ncbi:conserved Plasmodium protein, unknown function [Plasmodium berghei]|uniref:Uncharacterized protein n=2 Tax=Plasmodium berghei TaxID=5821 RepID=A0A509ANV3_PLABA|nr:conserved Plasmodium protein, unknown function [Plasmodium berghei ANKA]CXI98031.1 conserved Plasmodium protein, unknown function [Plasmodium berghei]SCL97633.1 conserved Plasmodium protein, unknown function [Plasmodium berghei]SCM16651.1 conserved Plasmodium protein, unknown function [Plasmodium berghei]SCM18448.1 conserved Plasmodium protein, unknown function [Plasmodium berghei]SCN27879.1 conserved Plasmodium protein, unknown function [Plasmodium berghei]|eukprot:XP_034423533.1 conserved Plasmodium protein, unknown function [Plasmodium berghei ANKA]
MSHQKNEGKNEDYFTIVTNYFYHLIYGNQNTQSSKSDCLDKDLYDDIVEKHKNSVHQIVYNLKLKRESNFNIPTRFSINSEIEKVPSLKESTHTENKIIENYKSQQNEDDNTVILEKYDMRKSQKKKKGEKKKKKNFESLNLDIFSSEAFQSNRPNQNEVKKETKNVTKQNNSESRIYSEGNKMNSIIKITEKEKKTTNKKEEYFEYGPIDEMEEKKSNENIPINNKKERKKKKKVTHNNFIKPLNNKVTNLYDINKNNHETLKKTKCNTNKKSNNDNMTINYIFDNNKKFVKIKSNKEKKDDIIKLPKINLVSHNNFLSSEEENEKRENYKQ